MIIKWTIRYVKIRFSFPSLARRHAWDTGYRHWKWTQWSEFKAWGDWFAIQTALKYSGNVCIQVFSIRQKVVIRADSFLTLVWLLISEKEYSKLKPVQLRLKITLCQTHTQSYIYIYIYVCVCVCVWVCVCHSNSPG